MAAVKSPDQKLANLVRYLEHLRDNVPTLYQHSHQQWVEHFDAQIVAFTQQFGVRKIR